MNLAPEITWTEGETLHRARWRSQHQPVPPARLVVVDDRITADAAYRLACEGTAMLWRGDFQNARQLLQALTRRAQRRPPLTASSPPETFHLYRQAQSQRARTTGMLLLEFEADHTIQLRRAPDVSVACLEAYGPAQESYLTSLRELQGLIGAHEWRKTGVEIPVLGQRIYPHYGVFAPLRTEYVELVAQAPLVSGLRAFDIGTGTGVLAAVLARRGAKHITATDNDPRALACARENIVRLGLSAHVDVLEADLFPPGRAALVVCNPPWIPARPTSSLERAIYDPQSRMLYEFLRGLPQHLESGGEGWLILSDIAEHLGLRTRAKLSEAFEKAGLRVMGRTDRAPTHSRVFDKTDPLHTARKAEITSLWRLTVA